MSKIYTRVNQEDHESYIMKHDRERKLNLDQSHRLKEMEARRKSKKKKDRQRKTRVDVAGANVIQYCSKDFVITTGFNMLKAGEFFNYIKQMRVIFSQPSDFKYIELLLTTTSYLKSLGYKAEHVRLVGDNLLKMFVGFLTNTTHNLSRAWQVIQSLLRRTESREGSDIEEDDDCWDVDLSFLFGEVTDDGEVHYTALEDYIKKLSATSFAREIGPRMSMVIPLAMAAVPLPATLSFLKSPQFMLMYGMLWGSFDSFQRAMSDFITNILPHLLDGEFVPSTDKRQIWLEQANELLDAFVSPAAMMAVVKKSDMKCGDGDREIRRAYVNLCKKVHSEGQVFLTNKDTALTNAISKALVALKATYTNASMTLQTSAYVEQPVVILWYGKPGVGKTELVESMSRHLSDLLGLFRFKDPVDGVEVNDIYTLVSTAKYMNGYKGQDVVVFDDFGATVETSETINDIFLKGCGSFPYFPDQAALELKGNVQWAGKLVHVTSNHRTCYLQSHVHCMEAWNRRMSIQVEVIAEYKDGDKTHKFNVYVPNPDGNGVKVIKEGCDRAEMARHVFQCALERKELSKRYTKAITSTPFVCQHGKTGTECDTCYPQKKITMTLLPGYYLFEDLIFYSLFMCGAFLGAPIYTYVCLYLLRFILELTCNGDITIWGIVLLAFFPFPFLSMTTHIFHNEVSTRLLTISECVLDPEKAQLWKANRQFYVQLKFFEKLKLLKGIWDMDWTTLPTYFNKLAKAHAQLVVDKTLVRVMNLTPKQVLLLTGGTVSLFYIVKKFLRRTKLYYTQLGLAVPPEVATKAVELEQQLGVTPMFDSSAQMAVTQHPSYPFYTAKRGRAVDVKQVIDLIESQVVKVTSYTRGTGGGESWGFLTGNLVVMCKHALRWSPEGQTIVAIKANIPQYSSTLVIYKKDVCDIGLDIVCFTRLGQLAKNLTKHILMGPVQAGEYVRFKGKDYISAAVTVDSEYLKGSVSSFQESVNEGDSGTIVYYIRKEQGEVKNVLLASILSGYMKTQFGSTISLFAGFTGWPTKIDTTIVHNGHEDYDLATPQEKELIPPNSKYAIVGHIPSDKQPIVVGSFSSKGSQRASSLVPTDWLDKFPAIKEKYTVPTMVARVENGEFISNELSCARQMAEAAAIHDKTVWVGASLIVRDHFEQLVGDRKFQTMSISQACSGFDQIPSLNMSTSIGFPFAGPKGDFFYGTTDVAYPDKRLLGEIEYWINNLSQGITLLPLVRGSVKDEVTTIKKAKKGEERIFFAGSTTLVILLRVFYGDFMEWLGSTRFKSFCCVGINALGPEWGELVKYLNVGDGRLAMDSDYSKFDKRMNILSFAVDMVTEFIIDHSKMSSIAQQRMRTLSASIHQYCMDVRGDIYHYASSTPSGVFGTTHFNCVCEAMIECAVYVILWGKYNNHNIFDAFKLARQQDLFFSRVRLVNYGDDNVKTAPVDDIETFYNAQDIQLYSRALGYDLTAVEKDGSPLSWKSIEKCTFLKRGFKFEDGRWLAPLEIASIEKSICFYDTKTPLSREDWESTLKKNMMFEIVLHGQEEYERLARILDWPISYDDAYKKACADLDEGVKYTAGPNSRPAAIHEFIAEVFREELDELEEPMIFYSHSFQLIMSLCVTDAYNREQQNQEWDAQTYFTSSYGYWKRHVQPREFNRSKIPYVETHAETSAIRMLYTCYVYAGAQHLMDLNEDHQESDLMHVDLRRVLLYMARKRVLGEDLDTYDIESDFWIAHEYYCIHGDWSSPLVTYDPWLITYDGSVPFVVYTARDVEIVHSAPIVTYATRDVEIDRKALIIAHAWDHLDRFMNALGCFFHLSAPAMILSYVALAPFAIWNTYILGGGFEPMWIYLNTCLFVPFVEEFMQWKYPQYGFLFIQWEMVEYNLLEIPRAMVHTVQMFGYNPYLAFVIHALWNFFVLYFISEDYWKTQETTQNDGINYYCENPNLLLGGCRPIQIAYY